MAMVAAAVEAVSKENSIRNSKYFKGVQYLVESGIKQVPDAYIQPPDKRVSGAKSETSSGIPVIDLAGLKDERRSGVLAEVRNACQKWGFFQVINHGVPVRLIERMMDVVRRFHELPTEEKMVYYSSDQYVETGTHRFRSIVNANQAVLEWRDSLLHKCYPSPEEDKWLTNPIDFRDAAMDYCREVRKLTKLLMAIMSEGLDLSPDTLEKVIGDEFAESLLMNYYPPCPDPELVLGVDSHSDPGALTVVLQDEVGGLQVLNEGRWIDVNPLANAFVVNVGDEIEVVSNGIFKSVAHRVIRRNGDGARLSIANFALPTSETRLGPIAELTETAPPLYKEHLFYDFISQFGAKYYDGKNLLDDFKLPNKA